MSDINMTVQGKVIGKNSRVGFLFKIIGVNSLVFGAAEGKEIDGHLSIYATTETLFG